MGKTLAMAASAGGALTGALWLSTARADAAAVRADPIAPSLTDPDVPGEQRWVSSADGTRLNMRLHGPKTPPPWCSRMAGRARRGTGTRRSERWAPTIE